MKESSVERLIEAGKSDRRYWRDLWEYRELLVFLAWRDVKVRYKQTAIGVTWVVLRPLLTMLVLTFVFNRVAGLEPDGGVPYPMLVLAAVLPWQYFAATLVDAGNSMVGNAQMVSKVYFPRILVPLSAALAGLVDFMVSLILLVLMMAWYGTWPGAEVLFLPVFLLAGMALSVGLGIGLSALNVEYRDVRYVLPFVVQFGLYISPVGFSSSALPEAWRWMYDLNPMVGIIEGFRWTLLGADFMPSATALASSFSVSVLVLSLSVRHFRRVENRFADMI